MAKKIGVIPVRIGSKSIPKKNIKLWNNYPLFYWCCKAMEDSKEIDEFHLASDSDEIDLLFNEFNFLKGKLYSRDKINSQDDSSTEDFLIEFLQNNEFDLDDTIVLSQATSPYTDSNDIDSSIQIFNNSKYNSVLSVVEFNRYFWNSNGDSLNYNFKNRKRRQDSDVTYLENGAIYISKCLNILKNKCRLTEPVGYYLMDNYDFMELDELDDWNLSEYLYNINKDKKKNYRIKLFVSDIDGTLTDGGMYYNSSGEFLKKFNTRDGMGFELLRNKGIKTALITSENHLINIKRSEKLKIDFLIQGKKNKGKLSALIELIKKLNITLDEVAYIGDDINCREVLESVSYASCPYDADDNIKNIQGIYVSSKKGGDGCVRDFCNKFL